MDVERNKKKKKKKIVRFPVLLGIIFALLFTYFAAVLLLREIEEEDTSTLDCRPSGPAAELCDIERSMTLAVPCFEQTLACTDHRECRERCGPANVLWVCDKGVCSPRRKHPNDRECIMAHGGVWTISNLEDTRHLMYRCVCLYPEFFHGATCSLANPYACANGGILQPLNALNDRENAKCICPSEYVQVHYKATALNRSVPYCVPKQILKFLQQSTSYDTSVQQEENKTEFVFEFDFQI